MKHAHQLLNLFIFMMMLVVIGCTNMPTQEMSNARQALKAANNVKAEYYVPTIWAQAKQYLIQAEQYLETNQFYQARKFAINAKQQAVNAHNMAAAIEHAINVWQNLTVMGNSTPKIRRLLEKAQKAARQGEVDKTIAFADAVSRQGKSITKQTQTKQTKKIMRNVIR